MAQFPVGIVVPLSRIALKVAVAVSTIFENFSVHPALETALAHTIHLNEAHGVAIVRYGGVVTLAETLGVTEEIAMLHGRKMQLTRILDFRNCRALFSTDEIKKMVEHEKRTDSRSGPSKRAVITANAVIYGQFRIFSTLSHGYQVETQVFRTPSEADVWLNLGIETEKLLAA